MGSVMIVSLDISSFRGISPGAVHFYGKLKHGRQEVELKRPMSAEEAAALNAKDRWTGWREGMETARWNSIADLYEEAFRVWKDHFPRGALLVVGDPSECDPRETIAGPPEWKNKLNEIWRKYEELDGWEGDDEERVRELCDEWDGYCRGFKA
jgi:hypothetical protein